jgi:hypothetical protein
MKAQPMTESFGRVLDVATFAGVTAGLSLLICSFFFPNLQFLAVPGLLFLVPSLVYGLR